MVTCKNEKDPIKTEGARMLASLYVNLSDTQGQLLWLSLLPARIKKIQSKMKALE